MKPKAVDPQVYTYRFYLERLANVPYAIGIREAILNGNGYTQLPVATEALASYESRNGSQYQFATVFTLDGEKYIVLTSNLHDYTKFMREYAPVAPVFDQLIPER